MAEQVRVFVSHHHSPEEDIFTARLVADLEAAGADVWVDTGQITSGNFVRKINEGLAGRQWLVLVMTPESLHSRWVQDEVDAALHQVNSGRMLDVIPVVAKACDEASIPALWATLHRYDATRDYETARDGLLRALGLSLHVVSTAPQPAAPHTMPAPAKPPESQPVWPSEPESGLWVRLSNALMPRYPVPDIPSRLASLGFRGVNVNGAPAIIPPLVTIPAGSFLMGSNQSHDKEAWANELPQHRVDVAAFHIAKYPVTVAEYSLAERTGAVPEPQESEGITWEKQLERPDHPVVCVSWSDVMAYITWLISATGQHGWRLPSESEWEKAARWDSHRSISRIYPWGDFFDRHRCNTSESGRGTTSPVGSYPANAVHRSGVRPFEVEEMAGNVWEWTSSLYEPYTSTRNNRRQVESSTDERSLRGGSWYLNARDARAACRNYGKPSFLANSIGFRLAFGLGAG